MEEFEGKTSICISCHAEKICYSLRTGVLKCADCISDQVGKSVTDLFRKSLSFLPKPAHVLISLSNGSSSQFVWDIFQKKIKPSIQGKTAIVKKLECLSTYDFSASFNSNKISKYSTMNVINYANENNFNCVIFCDSADHVTLANIAALACGRPDLEHWYSTDDFTNFSPIVVLRPARQCLKKELQFYCRKHGIQFDDSLSPFERAFSEEQRMIQDVVKNANGAMPFSVQKFGEHLPTFQQNSRCPVCGLPAPNDEICQMCSMIQAYE